MSKKIIGVYPMFNTGGICVHAIDDAEDKVLASVNALQLIFMILETQNG